MAGGGKSNGRGCGGGADPSYCFSFRIMWRTNGMGEAYIYVPEGKQAPDFCTYYPPCRGDKVVPCTACNFAAGVSMGRGGFTFNRGQWNKITMTLILNSPNVTDGVLEVKHNDRVAIRYDKVNWRQIESIWIEGVEVSTWFGGSDDTWAPPYNTHIMMRNFRAWRSDPPAVPTARSAALMFSGDMEQVLEVEEMTDIAD